MNDMMIKDVRVSLVCVPWVDPPPLAFATGAPRNLLIVEIETKEESWGWAICTSSAMVEDGRHMSRGGGGALVKGRDATSIEAIWRDLWRPPMASAGWAWR